MPAPAPAGEAASPSPPRRTGGAAVFALALALTFAAGMVDATGFLAFGGVFVSFMSGDTTRLGVALAQGAWPTGVLFVSVILLFVAGAAVGRVLAVAAGRWRRPVTLVLTGLLLFMAAAVGRLGLNAAALILAAPAMGVMNAAVTYAEGVPVTPTYVTGTLVRLGDALADWALGRSGRAVVLLLAMWVSLLLGAGVGARAFARWELTALLAPAALVLVLAVASALVPALRPSRSEP